MTPTDIDNILADIAWEAATVHPDEELAVPSSFSELDEWLESLEGDEVAELDFTVP